MRIDGERHKNFINDWSGKKRERERNLNKIKSDELQASSSILNGGLIQLLWAHDEGTIH